MSDKPTFTKEPCNRCKGTGKTMNSKPIGGMRNFELTCAQCWGKKFVYVPDLPIVSTNHVF